MAYEVSTPVYEGPFDLLLHLIAKEQVNLFEVSISRIVDAFLVEIEKLQAIDLEVATEFLLIASTLVELKLRRLLPERQNVEMEEELALLEERDLLLAKLLEYQTFRHAADALRKVEQTASRSFPRTNVTEESFAKLAPDPLANVTPVQLRAAFLRAITRSMIPKVEPRVSLSHVTDVRLTVADAVSDLARQLPRLGTAVFRSLLDPHAEPMEIIVRFLATLELYKQGWVDLDQSEKFGDLRITWIPDGPEINLSFLGPNAMATATAKVATTAAPGAFDFDVNISATETTLDSIEDTDVEAELDAAIAAARAERQTEPATLGRSDVLIGGIRIDVDDYEG